MLVFFKIKEHEFVTEVVVKYSQTYLMEQQLSLLAV